MKIASVMKSLNIMRLLIILFFLPAFLFSYDGMIHLHVSNLNSFYRNMQNNKIFKKISKSKNWNNFKSSKLYFRLFEDIKKMDPDNKILNFKNIEKIPETPMDFYLINIENETFIAKIKLEKSQLTALTNIDFVKMESTVFLNRKIYKYQEIYISQENSYLYISNSSKYLKDFIGNNNSYDTNIKLKDKYKNYIYLNLSKINKTPYLRNYWFTNFKDFYDFKSVIINFNLTDKIFEENGIIELDRENYNSDNLMVTDDRFKIMLFNAEGKFQISPFIKNKKIKIYSLIANDFKTKVYLAKYTGSKPFYDFLKEMLPSAKVVKNKFIEYHYGLMNRKTIFIKTIDNYLLFSDNVELLKDIKLKKSNNLYQLIKISDFKNISNELVKLSELDKNNYSYNIYLNSYLLNYMNLKYFEFTSVLNNKKKIEFKTKIIF